MLIRKIFKSKAKVKKEASPVLTSTPNASGTVPREVAPSPDVSIIERTSSSPFLVSSESVEELEIEYFNRRVRVLPGVSTRQRREENPQIDNNSSHIEDSVTEHNRCSDSLSRMQMKQIIRRINADKTETNYTKSCGNVSGRIDKTSSPFRKNCSLQTLLTVARQTSPLQIPTDPSYKNTTSGKFQQSKATIRSQTYRFLPSIPSLSCPSSPRDSRSAHLRSRSRSSCSGSRESSTETRRRSNTLKDIIEKTSTPITDAESNTPISVPSGQRCIKVTPGPASVARSDVQELYFNVEMKCKCKPCRRGSESTEESPTSTCVPDSAASIRVVTVRCNTCGGQQSVPGQTRSASQETSSPSSPCQTVVAVCTAQSNQAQTEPRGSLQSQSPCKTDTGTNLSGAESLRSETGSLNSAGGACNAKRARYLQTKLHATQLCLKNKEETVKVQAESLTCAEQRIAMLTLRAAQQRRELEACQQELCKLKGVTMKTEDTSKSDASCSTCTNPCRNMEANTEESMDTSNLKRENNNLKELNQELEMQIAPASSVLMKTETLFFNNNYFRKTCNFFVYPVCCFPKSKISELLELKTTLEITVREKDDSINCLRRENEKLGSEIRGLRSELEAAKKRIGELQNENGSVRMELTEAKEEAEEMKAEVCRLQARNEELQRKNQVLSEELEKADDIIKENCKVRSEVSYLSQQVSLWRQQLGDSEQRVHMVEAELARARVHCRNVDQCYREKVDAVAALEIQLERAHSRGAKLCAESRRVVATVRNWIQRMKHTNAEQSQKIKAQQSLISVLQKALHVDTRHQPSASVFKRPSQTNIFPRQSQETREFTVSEEQQDLSQDLADFQQSCDYYASNSAPLSQAPYDGVGCSKCAAKRPADPSRSPTDDSDDILLAGHHKWPSKRRGWSKGVRSEITIGLRMDQPQGAPNKTNRSRKDRNEDTESGSVTSQNTSAGREDVAIQASTSHVRGVPACSHVVPTPPRRLLCNRGCSDRATHYMRWSAGSAREAAVQRPVRRDGSTSPSRIPVPRAVSPTGELLDRVSRLSEAMEESQQRWSRSKPTQPQPQREHR